MEEQLKIYACDDGGNKDESNSVSLQINPSTFNFDFQNCYSSTNSIGSIESNQKFNKSEPGKLSFKAVLDGTGSVDSSEIDVRNTVDDIMKLCYKYQGDKHEPNKLIVLWGNVYFKCCLTKIGVSYKLLSPDGKLLRAELDFSFEKFVDSTEEVKIKNSQSPDITHVMTIKTGTSLPSLCEKVYNNRFLYTIIAKVNNLTDFRFIEPGTKIILPPIK